MATAAIRDRLPAAWALVRGQHPEADAMLALRAPDGAELSVIVEAKQLVEPRSVPSTQERLGALAAGRPGSIGLVAARYLPSSTRERLAAAGLSYADATGNLLVRADSPALLLADRGADRDPWRTPGRPRGTLNGEPAAKIVRTLADIDGPWRVRDLVRTASVSTGSVYRVVEFLEAEGLAVRDDSGLITVPDWAALLRRWSKDYQFLQTNTVTRWIAPRGLPALLDRVRSAEPGDYALTGSIAASAWQSYAPARSAMVYVSDPERTAEAWGVRATQTGANVLLVRPAYDVVFERTVTALDGLRLAAPTQVAVDLMTGPGRAPAEAEELLDWMGRNADAWR